MIGIINQIKGVGDMNYLKEINAFYVRIETNPLTGSATALWHALIHLNNRTGWMKEFTVAASVICFKSGLPLSTFKRARNELRDKGYIMYTSRGTKAPAYQMISLVGEAKAVQEVEVVEDTQDPREAQKKDDTLSVDTYKFYTEHFGEP